MIRSHLLQKLAPTKSINKTFQLARFGGMTGMENLTGAAQVEHFQLWETENRSGILITVQDKPGQLAQTLAILAKYNVNLTSIHSRPPKQI